jgi:phenylpyruvate tautomerase PptA (4-oxalocrotonate tautomerase family)
MPLVRISLVKGKPEAYRRKLGDAVHRALIAANLTAAVSLRPQDAWINLVEVAKENWSFGNGEASYAREEAHA